MNDVDTANRKWLMDQLQILAACQDNFSELDIEFIHVHALSIVHVCEDLLRYKYGVVGRGTANVERSEVASDAGTPDKPDEILPTNPAAEAQDAP